VIQARQLSAKRGARHISPEDLIFIIRDDRAKVNRLRTYMSWKEVRKNAKEPGGDGKADVDDAIDEGGEGWYLYLLQQLMFHDDISL
jgi:transcription initiation protein SPT3